MNWLACVIILALSAMLMIQSRWFLRERREDAIREKAAHAMCLAHIAHYVGNHFAAEVLKAAGEDYNSPQGQHDIAVIAREQWAQGGPSVPSIWMFNRADALIVEVDGPEYTPEYNLSGEPA